MSEYEDENCQQRKLTYQIVVDYKVVGNNAMLSQAKNIDITFGKRFLTLATDYMVTYLNELKACGYTDWKKGEPKDISGCEGIGNKEEQNSSNNNSEQNADGTANDNSQKEDCGDGFEPTEGKILYMIFKVENNKLTLGKDQNKETCEEFGDSPENRPIEFEEDFFERS